MKGIDIAVFFLYFLMFGGMISDVFQVGVAYLNNIYCSCLGDCFLFLIERGDLCGR